MKIAIIGMGWIGKKIKSELQKRNHDVYESNHGMWLHNLESITSLDYVINCAGYTGYPNVDSCELDKVSVYYANAILPIEIYNYCSMNKIKMAHFSSGCIYSGHIHSVYDNPNFFGSTYSISKGISDNYLKYRSLLFRIRMPFSNVEEPKNFISKIYQYHKYGKLYNGGKNSLTNIDEAVIVACDLIESKKVGPYNLVNSGSLDMQEIVSIMGITNPVWYEEAEFKLETKCLRSNCVIPAYSAMSDIKTSMLECVKNYHNK
jgi:dTDP-4-dehydrorhamnose reductase